MASTPPKGVHWNVKDISPSFLHSPALDDSTESYISTSSLEYLNAQLVAHGYAPAPGLSLDGLSGTDSERIVKCLLGMISQRMEDMSRTEQFSTKLRTLTYDHERLSTMHRVTNEKLANAEREVNVHKARLTASTRALQSVENAHKQTTAELQRTRTTLQGIRATHQQELKKKEKEFERMADKWNKLSDAQIKLTSIPAGMRCANAQVIDGFEHIPKVPSLLDAALDEAESARVELTDEIARLRRLVVKVCNQVQALLYQVHGFISGKDEEPPILSVTNLFPMHPPTHAHDTLSSVLRSLKDNIAILPQYIASSPATKQTTSQSATKAILKPIQPDAEEIARLKATIAQLQEEIQYSRKQTQLQATQTQELFENFIASQQKTSTNIAEMSMELMTGPMADAERERLDKIKRELDEEREKFTQAAVKLGKERAALEADRKKLFDEKRSWEVQQMLADLPPTPVPEPAPEPHIQPPQPQPRIRANKSPRKPIQHSPSKKSPRKTHKRQSSAGCSRKAARVSRKSSSDAPSKPMTIPAYETELVITTPEFEPQQTTAPPPPPLPAPFFSLQSATSILPSFVLPPPSPHASLPRNPLLPPSTQIQSIPHFDYLLSHLPPQSVESTPFPSSHPDVFSNSMISPPNPPSGFENHAPPNPMVTPVKRPFPVAKPFAQRMIHAYSPAKPSPLSRILMLNDSPNISDSNNSSGLTIGPTPARMDVVHEDVGIVVEARRGDVKTVIPLVLPETPAQDEGRRMSLAAELGVESPPDILDIGDEPPLKKRKADMDGRGSGTSKSAKTSTNGTRKPATGLGAGAKGRQRSRNVSNSRGDAGGIMTSSTTVGGAGGAAAAEKENGVTTRRKTGVTASSMARAVGPVNNNNKVTTRSAAGPSKSGGTTASTTVKAKTSTMAGGAGPRRVPINSAEAPVQIGRKKS